MVITTKSTKDATVDQDRNFILRYINNLHLINRSFEINGFQHAKEVGYASSNILALLILSKYATLCL